eukprot:359985-Chlamydomonas_euryale.AAC.2
MATFVTTRGACCQEAVCCAMPGLPVRFVACLSLEMPCQRNNTDRAAGSRRRWRTSWKRLGVLPRALRAVCTRRCHVNAIYIFFAWAYSSSMHDDAGMCGGGVAHVQVGCC